MIKLDKGELTWTPKTVVYKGKTYSAPVDLLYLLSIEYMVELLLERKKR